jgi:hydrogenase maturation protease
LASRIHTLILGIGNLLIADEGLGVHASRALLKQGAPPGSRVVEVGTSILDILPLLEEPQHIVVMDAMQADGQPGTIYRVPLNECRYTPNISSMHGFDLPRAMYMVGRKQLPDAVVFGVEPAVLDWSLELSPQVEASLPILLDAVRREVRNIGGVEPVLGAHTQ